MIFYVENQFGGSRFVKGSPPALVAEGLLGEDNSFSSHHYAFPNPVGLLERAMAGETIDNDKGPFGADSILKYMFSWRSTIQGHDFWAAIDRDLVNGGKMPEKVMNLLRAIWEAAQPKEAPPLEDML